MEMKMIVKCYHDELFQVNMITQMKRYVFGKVRKAKIGGRTDNLNSVMVIWLFNDY